MQKGLILTTLLAVILTARLGRVVYDGHPETYYNLRMDYVCQRATDLGIQGQYSVREDGCKMFGEYIIVATNWDVHPYGSLIETSRGMGIVLDHHTNNDKTTVDLATDWGKGGAKCR